MKNIAITIAGIAALFGIAYILLRQKNQNGYMSPDYGYSNPKYGNPQYGNPQYNQFGYISPNPDYDQGGDFWENPNFWLSFSQTQGGQDLLGQAGNMIMPEIGNILSLPSDLLGGLTSGFGLF